MFVVRIGNRGSVIWYGPSDVLVLPNANGQPVGLEADVRDILSRPSSPLRSMTTGMTLGVQPMKPGSAGHALEALLTLPDAELMHVDAPQAHARPTSAPERATARREVRDSVLAS